MIVWDEVSTARLWWDRALNVREVRAYVRRVLCGEADRIDLDDVDLMTAEIATNACRYTASGKPGGGLWITIMRSVERVRVEFQDDGGADTVPAIPESADVSGRGLRLVEELADDWGYRVEEDGQRQVTVWFEMRCLG